MKNKRSETPPRWAQRFLSWYCRPELLEDLQGDLQEYFERNLESKGFRGAQFIYILDTLKFLRSYTIRKSAFPNPEFKNIMISSYLKTARRTILRSRLFSGINVIGLAISMSVGLLVIAFVSDMKSYDQFHTNKERIFRVVSYDQGTGEPEMKLATSSVRAGEDIRAQIPGIESMTMLRNGFEGDAKTGNSMKIPLTGMYADDHFFNIFSFTLLKGNPVTALKEPHSIVLTETAAKKLFGSTDVLGKTVSMDTVNYMVTGLVQDPPKFSHIQFESLVSFSTINVQSTGSDGDFMSWTNIYSNYLYLLLPEHANIEKLQAGINGIAEKENSKLRQRKIRLLLQPLQKIAIGNPLGNEMGSTINASVLWMFGGLALVVILSACFNYTNLSIARSLRRSKEVGIRKVIGARRSQVIGQFITESVVIALLALAASFLLFLFLRGQFLSFHPEIRKTVELGISPKLILYFVTLAVGVGVIAGLLPALFYSKINAIQVLKDASTLHIFKHLSLRKALIIVQYCFSLIFITGTVISYNQYKSFISFDLGFSTGNILNIRLQGNKDDKLVKELTALPAVQDIAKSAIVTSLGSLYGTSMKYKDPMDSSNVFSNIVDDHYFPMHKYTFLAGRNFNSKSPGSEETEVIVNEETVKRFRIGKGQYAKAIGETVNMDNKKLTIVGVLKNFHYGTVENKIEPMAIRYSSTPGGYLNIMIRSKNIPETHAAIESIWSKIDPVHVLDAHFYDEQIEEAYSQFSVMIKIIGFFSFLAICIASMGLFGMVIYSTEKRLKEISIRKVLGASEGSLVYLLSRNFLLLLMIAAFISIPLTWIFFDKVVLVHFAYHQPIGPGDILLGFLVVAVIAFFMIGSHTLKIARANPGRVLKAE
jgi:putative ABC transport system permease protein